MATDSGKASLVHKGVVFDERKASFPAIEVPPFVDDPKVASYLTALARRCVDDIGLGYGPGTWQAILVVAMRVEQVMFREKPSARIRDLGPSRLPCVVVDERLAFSVGALGEGVSAMDRARLHTCLKWLGWPWGICLHFGKQDLDLMYVKAPESSC